MTMKNERNFSGFALSMCIIVFIMIVAPVVTMQVVGWYN